eukprot:3493556-Amphidinium_carterae.1
MQHLPLQWALCCQEFSESARATTGTPDAIAAVAQVLHTRTTTHATQEHLIRQAMKGACRNMHAHPCGDVQPIHKLTALPLAEAPMFRPTWGF